MPAGGYRDVQAKDPRNKHLHPEKACFPASPFNVLIQGLGLLENVNRLLLCEQDQIKAHHFLPLRYPVRKPNKLEVVCDEISTRLQIVSTPVAPHDIDAALIMVPANQSLRNASRCISQVIRKDSLQHWIQKLRDCT